MTRAVRTTDSTRPFPGGVLNLASAAALSARDRLLIFSCIFLITALGWVYLIHLDHQMSSAMEHDRMMAAMGMTMRMAWTGADFFFTFAMWAVMMVGMMAPSATPMLLLFAGTRAGRGERGFSFTLLAFTLGYLVVWAAFSACATLAQWGLHQAALLSGAMSISSPALGGAILLAAGVYQITPWKGACLAHCRSPLGFLMTNWRDGMIGAFQMGVTHGTYCLGCCWALMCVLFAVGVMNLVWVAALAVLVLMEKVVPVGAVIARLAGAALLGFGLAFILGIVHL